MTGRISWFRLQLPIVIAALGAVAVAVAAGCTDAAPASVEVSPAAWIHDRTQVAFSGPALHTESPGFWSSGPIFVVRDANGESLPTRRTYVFEPEAPYSEVVEVRLHEDLLYTGQLEITFDYIVDDDGVALDAAPFTWTVDPWVDEAAELDLGASPGPVTMLGGTDEGSFTFEGTGAIGAVWSSGSEDEPALHTAIRVGESGWSPLAPLQGWSAPSFASAGNVWVVAADCDDNMLCVAWRDVTDPFGWSGLGAPTRGGPADVALGDGIVVAVQRSERIEVWHHVSDWQALPVIPATEVVGRPLVGVPVAARPIVAFLDRLAPDQLELRVVALVGEAWTTWATLPIVDADPTVRLQVRGNDAYLVWTDGGLHAGLVSPAGLASIEPPTDAPTPRLADAAVSEDGDLVIAWIEDDEMLQVARYRRFAWEPIADPRPAPPAVPSLGLWFERAPVLGWIDGEALHVGLPNGPSLGR